MGGAEQRLRHCLTARTRRWAVGEFFYSAIDRPWFMQNELKVRRATVHWCSNCLRLLPMPVRCLQLSAPLCSALRCNA